MTVALRQARARRARDGAGRLLASVAVIVLIATMARRAPFVAASAPLPRASTLGEQPDAGLDLASLETALSLQGVDFTLEEEAVDPCEGALDRFVDSRRCADCSPIRADDTGSDAVAWLESRPQSGSVRRADSLHAARVECTPDGGRGTLFHLFTGSTDASTSIASLLGTPSARSAAATGEDPVPVLDGAHRVLRMTSGGWHVFVDVPARLPGSLEQLQVELINRGWVAVDVSSASTEPTGADVLILVRSGSYCVIRREPAAPGGLLVSMLRENGVDSREGLS